MKSLSSKKKKNENMQFSDDAQKYNKHIEVSSLFLVLNELIND